MKITTWNVNGIRSLKNSIASILGDLSSDIICLQETKISRSQLQENIALIDGFTSYFSYPRKQSGYSGVATYCKDQFTPDHAQEELTVNDLFIDEDSSITDEFNFTQKVDFEGRVMLTEHYIKIEDKISKLAIINVYCPRVDPEKPERQFYKMQFCQLLQSKMYQLCQQDCYVVIVGDLNIACSVIDHCDPGDEKEFKSSESRQWLNSFLTSEIQVNGDNVKPVDAFRYFYPDKKEAYTCWNTKTGARLTNYGTRIDYIIVSSNLIPALSFCDILSDYQGSDHCPVIAELKCDSVPEIIINLPSICTRLWPEFSGHQQKLRTFFKKTHLTSNSAIHFKPKSPKENKICKKSKQKSIACFFKNNKSTNRSDESSLPSVKTNCSDEVFGDSNIESNVLSSSADRPSTKSKPNEWKSLLCGPPKPPPCSKHNKPCVLRTVKKTGPNVGRQFFMCAQPVGPSSNPDSNCNYFKWVTAPKINTLKRS